MFTWLKKATEISVTLNCCLDSDTAVTYDFYNKLEKIKINNVGLNLRDPSIEVGLKEMGVGELGHLELSGVTDDGTRFMSVVQNKGDITEKSL
ncbi:unnamed protein product [Timema podura]|uniref:Uncharacterized protein n=1 Tax=Timema podura TaxID=61482 RepID=A0ABN7P3I1_TIMPD|nr:unnamed protein product [Timema podura]